MSDVQDRDALVRSYMELAQRSWSDEEFKRRLESDPRAALAEAGWQLPEGTDVDVDFFDPEGAGGESRSADEITDAWTSGIEAGELRLLVPDRPPPQLESAEISDEELAGASGGFSICGANSMMCHCQYTGGS